MDYADFVRKMRCKNCTDWVPLSRKKFAGICHNTQSHDPEGSTSREGIDTDDGQLCTGADFGCIYFAERPPRKNYTKRDKQQEIPLFE